jgi:hypothetical protein
MFVLLSDGAGLTARQCATLLSRAGHRVETLTPDPLFLCRLTRHVRTVHPRATTRDRSTRLAAGRAGCSRPARAGLLLPVQEQVAGDIDAICAAAHNAHRMRYAHYKKLGMFIGSRKPESAW